MKYFFLFILFALVLPSTHCQETSTTVKLETLTSIDMFKKNPLNKVEYELFLSLIKKNADPKSTLIVQQFNNMISFVYRENLLNSAILLFNEGNAWCSNITLNDNMNMKLNFKRKCVFFRIQL